MHKLIIASSTTLQILATLHKLLPVHPTGHMLRVQICDVGETIDSLWSKSYICYLSEMQTLFDTCNVHAQGILYIIISLLYTSGTQRVKLQKHYELFSSMHMKKKTARLPVSTDDA